MILQETIKLHSKLTPSVFLQKLLCEVEFCESFQLLLKLSPGGIAVRTIAAPKTTKVFFGQIEVESLKFAITNAFYDSNLSPFQPILHGKIQPQEHGANIEIILKPHSKAHPFVWIHSLAALALGFSGVLVYGSRPEMGGLAIGIALALFFFPQFRTRYSFSQGCRIAEKSLLELDLGWLDDVES